MSLKKQTLSNVKWSFVESLSLKAIAFILGIILARLLTPADFGLLAVVNVFYLLVTLFIDGGLKEALIQKKEVTDVHYSTVFWLNLFMGVFLYALLFVAAPYIEDFYQYKNLSFLIRLQSIVLIIESFGIIQIVKATKELDLKKITKARIPASLLSFGVGIFMAYHGYGVLSLIVQQLVSETLYTIFLVVSVKYRPTLNFNFPIVKELWSYGYKVILISLLSRYYTQFVSLLFAKYYQISALGLYTKARGFQNTPIEILTTSFNRGIYPTMVKLQNNIRGLRLIYLENVHKLTFMMVLINVFIYFNSEAIILVIFGQKWIGMKMFLQISALSTILQPMMNQAISIFKCKGKPQAVLRMELITKAVSLAMILILISKVSLEIVFICLSAIFSVVAVLYFKLCSTMLNFSFPKELLKLTIMIAKHFAVGFILNQIITQFIHNNILQIISFGLLFLAISYMLSLQSQTYKFTKLWK